MTLILERASKPDGTRDPLHWRDHRFVALDGLRFVAAFIVMMFHCARVLGLGSVPRGYLAVDFFFVLSGFVVAYAYEDRLLAGSYLLPFLQRRFTRLYPLCVFASALGFVVNPNWHPRIRDMLLAFGLIPQFKGWLFPVDIPLWSLFFEVVINVLYAAVLVRLSNRTLVAVLAATACYTLYFCITNGSVDAGGYADDWTFGFFRSLQSFGIGLLLCRWHRSKSGTTKGMALPALALVPLVTLLFGTMWVPPFAVGNGFYDWAVVAIVLPFLLICGAAVGARGRIGPLLSLGGEISYPLYVVHYPLLFVMTYVENSPHWQVKLAASAGFALTACVLSYLVYRFYDRPVRRWLTARFV